jgi:eukaryotic-like serine/threonine-protein kinase
VPADDSLACLDDDVIARFCDGLVSASEGETIRAHSATCEGCHRLLVDCLAARATGTARLPPEKGGVPRPALGAGTARLSTSSTGAGTSTMKLERPDERAELIGGVYRIERILGVGGMGTVYEATDSRSTPPRRVAIKTLHPRTTENPKVRERLAREATILASMRSPHVVRLHERGELPTGEPYLVMELLEGSDLHSVVTSGVPLAPDVVLRVMRDACDALGEAHCLGVVHRDVKPHNLFFARQPGGQVVLKILDFGLGTAPGIGGPGAEGIATRSSALLGTPQYMAPEQIRELAAVDARSDIFSLGATAYTLLTCTPPFAGRNVAVVLADVLTSTPRPLAEVAPAVSAAFAAIIERCLAKDPAARYPSCAALDAALARCAVEASQGSGSKRARLGIAIAVAAALLLLVIVLALLLR